MPKNRTPSQRGRHSRTKGQSFERDIVKVLKKAFGESVKRGWQSREGSEQCDVEGTPYWVECKRGKRVNWRPAIEQAINDSDGRTPIVIMREDRSDAMVVMRLEDWISFHDESS